MKTARDIVTPIRQRGRAYRYPTLADTMARNGLAPNDPPAPTYDKVYADLLKQRAR